LKSRPAWSNLYGVRPRRPFLLRVAIRMLDEKKTRVDVNPAPSPVAWIALRETRFGMERPVAH